MAGYRRTLLRYKSWSRIYRSGSTLLPMTLIPFQLRPNPHQALLLMKASTRTTAWSDLLRRYRNLW
eukprot:scaffold149_cov383-Prasinococcus_capsulatus_cf.AAC.31